MSKHTAPEDENPAEGTNLDPPKVMEYQPHPFSELNPPCSDEEADAMMLSVKAIGIQEDIILWRTGRTVMVLDGRTRLNAYNKLVEAGVFVTDRGDKLTLPTFYLPDTTTSLEAVQFVVAKASRRNLNKGQKACAGVRAHLELVKQSKKAGVPFEEPSDRGTYVAAVTGTNRVYCVRAFEMHEECQDIFDGVFTGAYSLNDGFRMLERVRKGLPPKPDSDEGDKAKKEQDEKDVYDSEDTLIESPRLIKVFRSVKIFKSAVSHLNKAKADLAVAGESPGGKHLEVEPLVAMLKDLTKIVNGSQPYVVCPKCKGDDAKRKACENCAKQGWLCARAAKATSATETEPEKKAKAEKKAKKGKGSKPEKSSKATAKKAAKKETAAKKKGDEFAEDPPAAFADDAPAASD